MRTMWSAIKRRAPAIGSSLLSVLYPSDCPTCGDPTDSLRISPFCRDCWSRIEPFSGTSCRVCAKPLASEHARECGDCLSQPPPFAKVIAFGAYENALKDAIHELKFRGARRLAKPLAAFLASLALPEADAIVPVPLTKRALRSRGFNQTLLLARELSKKSMIPLNMDVLHKTRETAPQIGLGAKDRLSNLRNAFGLAGSVSDLKLILVDDVMTTGATVRECARTLVKGGAKEVSAVVLARASLD